MEREMDKLRGREKNRKIEKERDMDKFRET